jgi:hypothetical protein
MRTGTYTRCRLSPLVSADSLELHNGKALPAAGTPMTVMFRSRTPNNQGLAGRKSGLFGSKNLPCPFMLSDQIFMSYKSIIPFDKLAFHHLTICL